MTEQQKMELEIAITRLETRIDSYTRTAKRTKKQAVYDAECGYRESAQFNKGQQFALEYVIEDLNIVLLGLKGMVEE